MTMTSDFEYIPPAPDKAGSHFVQTIRLRHAGQSIGQAIWSCDGDGVIQLLQLEIDTEQGRQGHGGRLLQEVIRQARLHHQHLNSPLRRIWMLVEQKSQVIGRAFLTAQGFHHVGTMSGLYKRQDALMYMRTFD